MVLLRRLAVLAAFVSFPAGGILAQTATNASGSVRFVLAPEGNEARYRVREQVANTFTDFGIPVPQVRMVLSVKDTIRVEYDFRLVRGG